MNSPAWIASVVTGLVLALPASASAVMSWQAPQALPSGEQLSGTLQDFGSRERSIHLDNAGNAVVEIGDNSGVSPYYRYLVRPHAGALGSMLTYPPGIGDTPGARPLVNVSAAGEVLVADTGTSRGNAFGPLSGVLASSSATTVGDPSAVSQVPSGAAAGIFIVSGAAPYVAFRAPGQGFNFAGRLTLPLASGDTYGLPVGIVLDPSGSTVAVYGSFPSGALMQSLAPAGGSFGTPTRIDSPSTSGGGGASMAWSRAGHAVVAWFSPVTTQLVVYAATRAPGQPFATATAVASNPDGGGFLGTPYVAVSDTGTAVVGYTRGGTASCDNGSVAEVATSTGGGWTINKPAGSNSALTMVSAGGDRVASVIRVQIGCASESLMLYSGTGGAVSGNGDLLLGNLANFGAVAVGPPGDMLVGYSASGAASQELRAFEDPTVLSTNPTLTVSLAGKGKGNVKGSTIDCPGTCTRIYAIGSLVTLTATPANGSAFTGWSGACSGLAACHVTMNSSRNVTATFSLVPAPSHTKITKAKINSTTHTARFGFTARGASSFQCTLIAPTKKGHKQPKPRFSSCRAPKTYKHLKAGKYTFLVRGVNHTGADRSAARKTFTIH